MIAIIIRENKLFNTLFNPLTALDVRICPKTVVARIGYSASHSQNFEKPNLCFR